ncbi:hypothetical protein Amal_03708 [Acetobacter malorum]|uniref:Uncharacterized protein n=1 Tax=Acetobacter malorum TaxID=178901 RepID=A0A177G493_9PROT|nr:hypothetical protein Amal_03708 [Acetobacter malorum]
MKTCSHNPVQNRIGDRENGHALMVRHVSADKGHSLVLGDALGRIIQRFKKAIAPLCAGFFQNGEIGNSFLRINHCGQQRGVGCHNHILRQTTLEPQSRNAKI